MEFPWNIIMWAIIILVAFTAIRDWSALKASPVKSNIDSGKQIFSFITDKVSSANTNTSTPSSMPSNSNNYGRIPCSTNEQCQSAYPSCNNCTCLNGDCLSS